MGNKISSERASKLAIIKVLAIFDFQEIVIATRPAKTVTKPKSKRKSDTCENAPVAAGDQFSINHVNQNRSDKDRDDPGIESNKK